MKRTARRTGSSRSGSSLDRPYQSGAHPQGPGPRKTRKKTPGRRGVSGLTREKGRKPRHALLRSRASNGRKTSQEASPRALFEIEARRDAHPLSRGCEPTGRGCHRSGARHPRRRKRRRRQGRFRSKPAAARPSRRILRFLTYTAGCSSSFRTTFGAERAQRRDLAGMRGANEHVLGRRSNHAHMIGGTTIHPSRHPSSRNTWKGVDDIRRHR